MSNKNISTGQYRRLLEILDEKEVDSERFQSLLPFLTDLCDPTADLSDIEAFRAALKLDGAGAISQPAFLNRNKHAHWEVIIPSMSLILTGLEAVNRLRSRKYAIEQKAEECFIADTASDSYNKRHRLLHGKDQRVVMVLGKEIAGGSSYLKQKDLEQFAKRYDYEMPVAGIVPGLREAVSDARLERELRVWSVFVGHRPLLDNASSTYRMDGQYRFKITRGPMVRGIRVHFSDHYPESEVADSAFAFLVPV